MTDRTRTRSALWAPIAVTVTAAVLAAACSGSPAPASQPASVSPSPTSPPLPTSPAATLLPAASATSRPDGSPAASALAAGVVSRWTGDGSAADVAGGAGGTLRNGATFAAGRAGQAFSFDGLDDYVELPVDVLPYPSDAPFTVEAWFLTESGGVIFGQQSLAPYGDVFQRGNGAIPAIYVGTDGRLRVQLFWDGRVDPITSEVRVDDGAFHHVAVVFDGALETAYLDGAPFGSREIVQQPYGTGAYHYQLGTGNTGVLWPAGPDGTGGWFTFEGLIDEVAIYDRARSAAEIAALL